MDRKTVDSFQNIMVFYNQYKKVVIAAVLLIAVTIGSLVYYQYSKEHYEKMAQQALAEILSEYTRAHAMPDLWNDVEVGARTGYRQYVRSILAPYFLMLQADALANQEKLDEALSLMAIMFDNISKKSPFYYLYALKQARMQLSHSDATIQQKGLDMLKQLAANTDNTQQDQALFYLAQYYEQQNDKEQARKTWQELAALADTFKDVRSPWGMQAKERVATF